MKIEQVHIERSDRGFTLIELLVTVAVIGVIAVIGVPGINALLENNRVTAHTNRLVSSMHLARSEAVKRNDEVTLCSSKDGATCDGKWVDGWIVKTKTEVLQVVGAPGKAIKVEPEGGEIIFQGDGSAKIDLEGETAISIIKAGFKRQLALSPGGSVHSCNPATDDGCDDQ
jgi:prepilin-type N-terminal cleavage/methylation domain-containing protein